MSWIVFGAYSCYQPLHPTSLGSAPWTVLTFGEFVKDFETRNNGKLRNGNEGFADLLLFDAGIGLRCVQKCVKHTHFCFVHRSLGLRQSVHSAHLESDRSDLTFTAVPTKRLAEAPKRLVISWFAFGPFDSLSSHHNDFLCFALWILPGR